MISIITIAWDAICAHRRMMFAVILMCTFAIVLCSLVVADSVALSEGERMYQNAFTLSEERILLIQPLHKDVSSEFISGCDSFRKELQSLDGCDNSGAFFYGTIATKQGGISKQNVNSDMVSVLYIDEEILGMCKTFLTKEEIARLSQDSEYVPLYVGSEYAETYPVGTSFTFQEKEYRIVGVLKKNASWIPDSGIVREADAYSLDNKFVTSTRFSQYLSLYGLNGMYVILGESRDADAVKTVIKKSAENHGIQVTVKNVKEYINRFKAVKKRSEKDYRKELLVVLLVSLISASAINVVSILFRKREIGILYACGYSRKDIMLSLFVEAIIMMIMSLILWFMSMILFAKWGLIDVFVIAGNSRILFFALLLIMIAILFIVTTLYSGMYLISKKPIEMLEDRG